MSRLVSLVHGGESITLPFFVPSVRVAEAGVADGHQFDEEDDEDGHQTDAKCPWILGNWAREAWISQCFYSRNKKLQHPIMSVSTYNK